MNDVAVGATGSAAAFPPPPAPELLDDELATELELPPAPVDAELDPPLPAEEEEDDDEPDDDDDELVEAAALDATLDVTVAEEIVSPSLAGSLEAHPAKAMA